MYRTFFRAGVLLAVVCSACSFADRNTSLDASRSDSGFNSDGATLSPDTAIDSGGTGLFASPTCGANEAPVVNGTQRGSFTCTPVGASTTTPAGDWPDTAGARMPLVYVRPGASGDGSMANPVGTIAEAATLLQTRGDGTIVLSPGAHTLTSTITFDRGVTLLGVGGPTGSIVQPPMDAPAFDAATPAGSMLAIQHVTINKDTPHTGPVLRALGDGSVHLLDVTIDSSDTGIALVDTAGASATLDAQGLTITRSTIGIQAGATNTVTLRSFLFDQTRVGVKSNGSSITAVEGAVHHFTGAGISGDFTGAMARVAVQLDRVALWDGDGYGAWLGGAMATITGSHLLVAGVHAAGGGGGPGIGLFVTKSAHLDLDTNIGSDAQQGLGSIVGANEGTGILFDENATATVRGAYIVSNRQTGLLVQATANVAEVGYSYFTDNIGTGLTVSAGGVIAGLLCNGFVANRAGAVQFASGAVTMQDGVVIAPQSTSYQVVVAGNLFESSARYGILCIGVDAILMNNTFRNNSANAVVVDGTATGAQAGTDVTQTPAGSDPLPGAVTTTGAP